MNRQKTLRYLGKFFKSAMQAEKNNWSPGRLADELGVRQDLNRRQLVRRISEGLAASGLLSACQPILSKSSDLLGSHDSSPGRVVIVGAGLAGLTVAHQLKKAGIKSSLFEARSRVGGRVITRNQFNKDAMFIELGAEFVDTNHVDLISLARELGLEIQEFVEPIPGLEEEVLYLNGAVVDPKSFIPEFRALARLVIADTKSIRNAQGDLVLPRFGEVGPGTWIDQLSLSEYLDQKRLQGISKKFIQLIEMMYLGMMGLEADRQNAFNLLTLMDVDSRDLGLYGDSDESKRIKGGNGRLVEALHSKVSCHSDLHLNHQLAQIKDYGSHFSLDFITAGTTKLVKADVVVMTVPMPVLKTVNGLIQLGLTPAKAAAIRSLGYATNSKYCIGFSQRPWRQKGNVVSPNYGTVWSDLGFPEMRDSSNNQPGPSGIILNYLSGKQGEKIAANLRGKTLAQLNKVYPGIDRIFDGNDHLTHWPSDPFARGSYICPAPGHYQQEGGFENQVELGGRLLFAGDSFSQEFGGYMNGAIETGKKVAVAITTKKRGLK